MIPDQGLGNVEIWKMLKNTELLDDDILVEEILHIKYEHSPKTQEIVSKFMKTGKLTKEERSALIGHYILYWVEDTEE